MKTKVIKNEYDTFKFESYKDELTSFAEVTISPVEMRMGILNTYKPGHQMYLDKEDVQNLINDLQQLLKQMESMQI